MPAVAIVSPPAETTVLPEYVLTPETDSVPAPALVRFIEAPEMIPEIVPVVATCTVESAAIATVPDNVPAAEKLTAPADDRPAPEIVSGSADVTAAATSNVAPEDTVVAPAAVPRPVALDNTTVP